MIYNKSITATVYLYCDGKVLLHEHKKYKTWFPLGGHLEADELPHQAAIREVKEESGIDAILVSTETAPALNLGRVDRVPSPFCIMHEGIGHSEEFLDLIYIGTANQFDLSPEINESKSFKWFSVKDLEENDVKIHIKNTAKAVIEYMKSKDK